MPRGQELSRPLGFVRSLRFLFRNQDDPLPPRATTPLVTPTAFSADTAAPAVALVVALFGSCCWTAAPGAPAFVRAVLVPGKARGVPVPPMKPSDVTRAAASAR